MPDDRVDRADRVDRGLHVSTQNITGDDFDRVFDALDRVVDVADQVSDGVQVMGSHLVSMGDDIQESVLDVVLDMGEFSDVLGELGDSFVRGVDQIVGYRKVMEGLGNRESVLESGIVAEDVRGKGDTIEISEVGVSTGGLDTVVDGVVDTESVESVRLALEDLGSVLLEVEEGFNRLSGKMSDISDVSRNSDVVSRDSRDQGVAQELVEVSVIGRLSNQDRLESEQVSQLGVLLEQLQDLEADYERERTRIVREEDEKRTAVIEHGVRERVGHVERGYEEIAALLREMEGVDDGLLGDRAGGISGSILPERVGSVDGIGDVIESDALLEAGIQAGDFMNLMDGIEDSLGRVGNRLIAFSDVLRREFTESVQSGVVVLNRLRQGFGESLREDRLVELSELARESDVISRLEDGQLDRDERVEERFAVGDRRYRSSESVEDRRALSYFGGLSPDVQRAIDVYREERAIELGTELPEPLRRETVKEVGKGTKYPDVSERLTSGAGDLVSAVPFDVVDAVRDVIQVRTDANAELVVMEREVAAEIQIIQESVTLSAENKAKAIERIERESALRRIRIENAVSERQRSSFQSVVTNFLTGIGKMIAAEAQLALARRATSALSGLFGGGGAVAAGGAGLFSSVLLPLLGGLSLAYGATKLIAPKSPGAEVYERSQFGLSGGVSGSERDTVETTGLTRASQETDTPVLEANINVSVEASGTRLGQANARERLKTERWGG